MKQIAGFSGGMTFRPQHTLPELASAFSRAVFGGIRMIPARHHLLPEQTIYAAEYPLLGHDWLLYLNEDAAPQLFVRATSDTESRIHSSGAPEHRFLDLSCLVRFLLASSVTVEVPAGRVVGAIEVMKASVMILDDRTIEQVAAHLSAATFAGQKFVGVATAEAPVRRLRLEGPLFGHDVNLVELPLTESTLAGYRLIIHLLEETRAALVRSSGLPINEVDIGAYLRAAIPRPQSMYFDEESDGLAASTTAE
jgi:hypothetical protein